MFTKAVESSCHLCRRKLTHEPDHQRYLPPNAPSFFLKSPPIKKILVGAVGIENTTDGNCKDLEGMMGNAKGIEKER